MEKHYSLEQAITSVMDLRKHLVSNIQIKTINFSMYTRHHGECLHVSSERSSWFMEMIQVLYYHQESHQYRQWSYRSCRRKKECLRKQKRSERNLLLLTKWKSMILIRAQDGNSVNRKYAEFLQELRSDQKILRRIRQWSFAVIQERRSSYL